MPSLAEAMIAKMPVEQIGSRSPDFWFGPSAIPKLCTKAMVIAWRMGLHTSVRRLDAESRWRMDLGTGIHRVIQEHWLGPAGLILGYWECPKCMGGYGARTIKDSVPAPTVCRMCGYRPTRYPFLYGEIEVSDENDRIQGHLDGLSRDRDEIWDFKITTFSELSEFPRPVDVEQVQLYLDLSGVHKGRLVYVDRGAKSIREAMVECPIVYDPSVAIRLRGKLRAFKEAISNPSKPVPVCPFGGSSPVGHGPCECRELVRAWEDSRRVSV